MNRKEFWARHDACTTKEDHTQLHREYYAQYVTPRIIALVQRCVCMSKLKASTDPHLNDIPLRGWDAIVNAGYIPAETAKQLKDNNDWLSLSTGVCILKEAARQIKERLTDPLECKP